MRTPESERAVHQSTTPMDNTTGAAPLSTTAATLPTGYVRAAPSTGKMCWARWRGRRLDGVVNGLITRRMAEYYLMRDFHQSEFLHREEMKARAAHVLGHVVADRRYKPFAGGPP